MITRNYNFGYTEREKEDRCIKFLNADFSYYDTCIIVDALRSHADLLADKLSEIPSNEKQFHDIALAILEVTQIANEFESFMISPL